MGMVELEAFVALAEAEGEFAGPQDEGEVTAAEAELGVRFPPTYRAFVRRLGAGDVAGEAFLGLTGEAGGDDPDDVVAVTLHSRDEWGLPDSMVVVYVDGTSGYYVLDTDKSGRAGEPPVEVWEPGASHQGDKLERIGEDFGSFALELVRDAR